MVKNWTPRRGDVVWLTFSPDVACRTATAGHERAGRRPAVVISPEAFNAKVRLALFCPITSQVKGYPFEVALPEDRDVRGMILADQIKRLDYVARNAELVYHLPDDALAELLGKIRTLTE